MLPVMRGFDLWPSLMRSIHGAADLRLGPPARVLPPLHCDEESVG